MRHGERRRTREGPVERRRQARDPCRERAQVLWREGLRGVGPREAGVGVRLDE
jgi:hypothetical protein